VMSVIFHFGLSTLPCARAPTAIHENQKIVVQNFTAPKTMVCRLAVIRGRIFRIVVALKFFHME